MRESQYADRYIDSGHTIGTYLHYQLEGRAKSYAWRYKYALQNAMERRVAAGQAIKGRSVNGGIAYYTPKRHAEMQQAAACARREEARLGRACPTSHLDWAPLVSVEPATPYRPRLPLRGIDVTPSQKVIK